MKKSIYHRFFEISKLYHFTSFEAACNIIKSGKLRFSKAYRLNDLIESNRVVWERTLGGYIPDGEEYLCYAEEEMRRYQQISFSQDRVVDNISYLGFDLHTMWGLYAERGYGVCLVFDKEKLMLDSDDYADDVRYVNLIPQGVKIYNKSKNGIKTEIKRRRGEIFFYKRKEWEYEQEYRVVRRAKYEHDNEYLDVTNSLVCAIVCKDESIELLESMFDSDIYHELRHINKKLPILTYEYDLDGYTLYASWGFPIWSEQCGEM
jgi:hypothetical protein